MGLVHAFEHASTPSPGGAVLPLGHRRRCQRLCPSRFVFSRCCPVLPRPIIVSVESSLMPVVPAGIISCRLSTCDIVCICGTSMCFQIETAKPCVRMGKERRFVYFFFLTWYFLIKKV